MNILRKIYNLFSAHVPFFFAAPALVWHLALLIIPLALIVANSFFDHTTWRLTFKYYYGFFKHPFLSMLSWSCFLAVSATIICLLLGYPIAFWLARKVEYFKNFFLFLIIIPFCSNILVLIYSWIFILERHGFLNTFLMNYGFISQPLPILNSMASVVIVAVYCYLPFMVLPLFSALEKIDTSIIEASSDLGGTFKQTFFKVILPMSWSGMRTGIFLVFVPVFGEYSIPLLIGSDKYMFAGTMVVRSILMPEVLNGAAFTVLVGIALLGSLMLLSSVIKYIVFKW